MTNALLESAIREQLNRLPLERQRQVLDFARSLVDARPRGVSGKQLLTFAGAIPQSDLADISQAISEGCGRIETHDW